MPRNRKPLLGEPLADLVEASEAVGATRSRLEKVQRLAEVLRRLAPDEVAAGVAFLSGELRQRQIGVGWAALRDLPPPAAEPSLTVGEVDAAFERIGGVHRARVAGGAAGGAGGAVRACDRAPKRASSCGCSAASCARARWRE